MFSGTEELNEPNSKKNFKKRQYDDIEVDEIFNQSKYSCNSENFYLLTFI
jgi:hypothetical protein